VSYPNLLNTVVDHVLTMPTVYHLNTPNICVVGLQLSVHSLSNVYSSN